jgi:hypothetical protein
VPVARWGPDEMRLSPESTELCLLWAFLHTPSEIRPLQNAERGRIGEVDCRLLRCICPECGGSLRDLLFPLVELHPPSKTYKIIAAVFLSEWHGACYWPENSRPNPLKDE